MKSELGRNLVSYQAMLRTVGAYLDEYVASEVSLVETPDSFAIRLSRPHDGTQLVELHYEDLVDRTSSLSRRRGRGALRTISPHVLTQGLARLEVYYQDLLRALGWELDDSSGYNVLLEEVEGAFLVTYMSLDPNSGYLWRKRSAKLGVPELEVVLKDAYGRRQPPPLQRRRVTSVNRTTGYPTS
jgi:hypothetical protein